MVQCTYLTPPERYSYPTTAYRQKSVNNTPYAAHSLALVAPVILSWVRQRHVGHAHLMLDVHLPRCVLVHRQKSLHQCRSHSSTQQQQSVMSASGWWTPATTVHWNCRRAMLRSALTHRPGTHWSSMHPLIAISVCCTFVAPAPGCAWDACASCRSACCLHRCVPCHEPQQPCCSQHKAAPQNTWPAALPHAAKH
jgi:hypothetical protein